MNSVALDASGVLASLNDEEGAREVESALGVTLLSAVNFSEVVGALDLEVVALDRERAEFAAGFGR